jgi:hypothetical protein
MSSSSRSMRWRRVTEHRLRRCRREFHPNPCTSGRRAGPRGGAGRRHAVVGARNRRQRPRRAWRRRWLRLGLLVPSIGCLTTKATKAHRRATRPTPAVSRMTVVSESSVAPRCDELSQDDNPPKHPELFSDCSVSLRSRSGQVHSHSTAHRPARQHHRAWRPGVTTRHPRMLLHAQASLTP